MTVRRVMGTETEFGISVQGMPSANPMVASSQVVNAYAGSTLKARRARWDFEEESPLRDARGFDLSRQLADPSQLTDEDLGLANIILTNAARRRPVGQGRGAGHARCRPNGGADARRHADQPVQEQHRQQGCLLRRAR